MFYLFPYGLFYFLCMFFVDVLFCLAFLGFLFCFGVFCLAFLTCPSCFDVLLCNYLCLLLALVVFPVDLRCMFLSVAFFLLCFWPGLSILFSLPLYLFIDFVFGSFLLVYSVYCELV